jgi:hypothetical protein
MTEIPNFKTQIPNSFQWPKLKKWYLKFPPRPLPKGRAESKGKGIGHLEIGILDLFGIWILGFWISIQR